MSLKATLSGLTEGRVTKASLTLGHSKGADAKRLRKRDCLKSPGRERPVPSAALYFVGYKVPEGRMPGPVSGEDGRLPSLPRWLPSVIDRRFATEQVRWYDMLQSSE
jgi:hypothetical protein